MKYRYFGIDVSKHNTITNFGELAKNIDFVILRIGYGNNAKQIDSKFKYYYDKFKSLGIKIGGYWYSYAESVEDAKKELKAFKECVKGCNFDLPIFYDIEEKRTLDKGVTIVNEIAKTFIEGVEKIGGFCGIYANTSTYLKYFKNTNKRYCCWIADYRTDQQFTKDTKNLNIAIRQYSCKGILLGVSVVDCNYFINDSYMNIDKKFNDFTKLK